MERSHDNNHSSSFSSLRGMGSMFSKRDKSALQLDTMAANSLRSSNDDVQCETPRAPLSDRSEDRKKNEADPDLLCFGDQLRLWACSEYALLEHNGGASSAFGDSNIETTGGYIGVYFKGRRRKARTRQQPLFCVPPLGHNFEGEFVESLFRVVDPFGKMAEGEPVHLGVELALVDADSHVWNTSTNGAVGYLAPRLRGEVGETRVRFVRDLKHYAPDSDWATLKKSQKNAPMVRFGDALWLVTCAASKEDMMYPGLSRGLRREHVLTNYKKETSSLLGGYLTIDARGYPLLFTVCRPAPALERVQVGQTYHYRVPWGGCIDLGCNKQHSPRICYSMNDVLSLELSEKIGGQLKLGDLVERRDEDGSVWLRLKNLGSTSSSNGHSPGGHNGKTLKPRALTMDSSFASYQSYATDSSVTGSPGAATLSRSASPAIGSCGSVLLDCSRLVVVELPTMVPPSPIHTPMFTSMPRRPSLTLSVDEEAAGNNSIDMELLACFVAAVAVYTAVFERGAAAAVAGAAASATASVCSPERPIHVAAASFLAAAIFMLVADLATERAALAAAFPAAALCFTMVRLGVLRNLRNKVSSPTVSFALPPPIEPVEETRIRRSCSFASDGDDSEYSTTEPTRHSRRGSFTLTGSIALLEWSPDGADVLDLPVDTPGTEKKKKRLQKRQQTTNGGVWGLRSQALHSPSDEEYEAVELLRVLATPDAVSDRWLEDAELLRFVRARKTLEQRIELFREAMDWRSKSACANLQPACVSPSLSTRALTLTTSVSSAQLDVANASNTNTNAVAGVDPTGYRHDPELGSFGGPEREWCEGSVPAPAWWAFISRALPFELYGKDKHGLPITYLGLGRMDLAGVSREIGLDRLEQKIVMQNDMFIDVARELNLSADKTVIHGGVMIIDCDGMGRRHLAEVRIFRRVSAVLKVLHPERQRKTFIVRAPRVFSLVWKLVKPMLDARIISKIQIFGFNESLEPLETELGRPYIPHCLGGEYNLTNPPKAELIANGAYEEFLKTYSAEQTTNQAAA